MESLENIVKLRNVSGKLVTINFYFLSKPIFYKHKISLQKTANNIYICAPEVTILTMLSPVTMPKDSSMSKGYTVTKQFKI